MLMASHSRPKRATSQKGKERMDEAEEDVEEDIKEDVEHSLDHTVRYHADLDEDPLEEDTGVEVADGDNDYRLSDEIADFGYELCPRYFEADDDFEEEFDQFVT